MIDIKDMSHAPPIGEIDDSIGLSLFDRFCQYMNTEYKAIRKIEYSKDVWARGWNVWKICFHTYPKRFWKCTTIQKKATDRDG